jgi:hypothetical protein
MKYVCVATEMKLYLPYLKQLLPDLVILGLNTPWEGFITKYKLLRTYLATLPDETPVCFIDAYDVLPTKQIEHLEAKYLAFMESHPAVKIIVGYDKVDNFLHEYMCQLIFGMVDALRLNSGQFIGNAKHIREMITHIFDTTAEFQTDQIEMTKYANQFKAEVYIDEPQEFFYVKSRPLQQVLLPTNVGANVVGANVSTAAFIHANGNGLLDKFLRMEHGIQINQGWYYFIENLRGVLKKIGIYEILYIKRKLVDWGLKGAASLAP